MSVQNCSARCCPSAYFEGPNDCLRQSNTHDYFFDRTVSLHLETIGVECDSEVARRFIQVE